MINLVWIITDLTVAAGPADVWWLWAGMPSRAEGGLWSTSLADPLLLCVHAAAGVAAMRSASAAGALVSAAAVTLALRSPVLWMLQADWMRIVDEELRTQATLTAGAGVVLGAALLVVVAVGRRPVDGAAGADGAARVLPVRPGPTASVIVFLLLAAASGTGAAWQVHWAREWGRRTYGSLLTGDGPQNVYGLLQPPYGWLSWTIIGLGLVGAVAALCRATFSRPLGMTAAAMLLAWGLAAVSVHQRTDAFRDFGDLPVREQLSAATALFETLAGIAVLWVLARCGERPGAEPYEGAYSHDGIGVHSPPPPSPPPPGW
ncbi:hypothetical protein ABZW18_08440 [Streptomyces sp. NPDC004647]|uniref:hypothetical protein n=1 Tax=Streptomyces sp. NPDC004647 TaxID=3154671 RepID=UPI0033BC520C